MTGFLSDMLMQPESGAGPVQTVTPGASPYTYTARAPGSLSIQGGTVSLASFSRNGAAVTLGLTSGLVPLAAGDSVTVTYAVAPTLTFIPR